MHLAELRNWLRVRSGDAGVPMLPVFAPEPQRLAGQAEQPPEPAAKSAWTPLRLEIAEALWGDGCHLPGGTAEVLRLAAPLGLSAASSLLFLGAGSGGPTLRLAGDLGVWVCACESDPVLAAAAAKRVQRAGVALVKRATVQAWNPAAPAFRRAAYHHAISVEALHRGNAEDAVAAVAHSLKPSGQVVVVETVAGPSLDASSPALRAWCRLEQRDPPQIGAAELSEALERLGFDIRICEDVTARQIRHAVGGWKRLVRELREERPTPLRAAAMVAEAELWLRRIHLLRSGQLRFMSWHAIGPGGSAAKAMMHASA